MLQIKENNVLKILNIKKFVVNYKENNLKKENYVQIKYKFIC
jgi:hypothetical protein